MCVNSLPRVLAWQLKFKSLYITKNKKDPARVTHFSTQFFNVKIVMLSHKKM